jgi:hypothetical protein
MPESYAEAWRKADEDYDRRERQRVAQEIEDLLRGHHWDGGFHCRCGAAVDVPGHWGRHLLQLALNEGVDA